jgi:hypothetical protein
MEALTQVIETTANDTALQADLLAITELSAHDLALVGGGIATVVFM